MSEMPVSQRSNIHKALWTSSSLNAIDSGPTSYTGSNGNSYGGRINLEKFVRNLPGWTAPTDIQAGVYQVANVNSGKCLDVRDDSTANGAAVQQWGCDNGESQKWRIEPVGNGLYKLKAMHSGKVMDVSSTSTADRAKIHQWEDLGTANQKWQIQAYGSGYRLIASHSGKCLDLFYFAVSDGFQLEQNICNAGTAQQFKLKALF